MFCLKGLKNAILLILSSFFALSLIYFHDPAINGAVKGLYMCADVLIPSLFPFMVCVLILTESINSVNFKNESPLLKVLILFILSSIGGYPIGAMILNEEVKSERISPSNAEKMLGFCANAGPGFIIIAIGAGVFHSVKIGALLFFSSLFSALTIGLFSIFSSKEKIEIKKNNFKKINDFSDVFVGSTAKASASMINICSFVVLFCVINSILENFSKRYKILNIIIYLNEVSCSVFKFKNIYAVGFIIGFGGICVIMQILAVTENIKINIIKLFLIRIFNGFLCLLYSSVLIKVFNCEILTAVFDKTKIIKINSVKTVFVLITVIIFFLISIQSKKVIGKKEGLCYNNLTALAKSKILTPERTLKHNPGI